MRPVSIESLRQEAEPRALQQLRARRLIVAGTEPRHAGALAEALRAKGAVVVALSGPDGDLDAALALDADAIVGLDPVDTGSACEPIIEALRGHPRARWASVIRVATAALGSEVAHRYAIASIASHVGAATAASVELAVRAKGKLPHATRLQPLGMNRVLRVLADTQRALRLQLSGAWGVATLELREGRVLGVRAEVDGSPLLSDAHALAALLALSEAQLRIEAGGAPARGWNVPIATALARASALAHPDRPHIAWAQVEPSLEDDGGAPLIEATDAEIAALDRVLDGPESGTRQRSDLAATRETPLLELIAHVEATRVPTPTVADRVGGDGVHKFTSLRGRFVAGVGAVALLAAVGVVLLVRTDPQAEPIADSARRDVRELPRSTSPVAGTRTARAEPTAPTQPPTQLPSAEAEPAQAAGPEPESAPPPSSLEQPDRLKEAQLLVKRARRQRRAGQLEQAEVSYLEAASKLANYPLAMAGLTRVYLDRKNGVEAVRWAERLVTLQPKRDSYQLLLGDAYAQRGDRAEAEQAWRKAKELGSRTARKRLEMR